MRLLLSDVELMKLPVKAISEIIEEGIFKVSSKNGLEFVAADRAMICMVEFKLLPTAFDEFEVKNDLSLGLNIETLSDILRRATKKDKLVLEFKENRLITTLEGKVRRSFELPLLDITEESLPDISQLEFSSKIALATDALVEAAADVDLVAESIVFEADENKLSIYGAGDISRVRLDLPKDDTNIYEFEVKENTKARYPLDYIKKILTIKPLTDSLTLEFGNDYPCKISSKILDKVYISFVVAPRVE